MNRIKYLSLACAMLIGISSAFASKDDDDVILKQLQKTKEKIESSIDDRPEFKLDRAPGKWDNESAVILYKYLYYETERKFNSNFGFYEEIVKVYSKYRIKLQDKYAINDFSEFYFGNRDMLQVRVIKTDGTEYELDMDEAVTSDTKVDDFLGLSGVSLNVDSYKKIPVSNLDQGDMLEVTVVSENVKVYNGKTYHYNYTPSLETLILAGSYPICHQFIEFNIEDPFRLNFRSLNGAPKIEAIKVKDYKAKFLFHDSMRGRVKSEYWSGGVGFNPSVKYVLSKVSSGKLNPDFANKDMAVKSEVTDEEVLALANFIYKDKASTHSGFYVEFLKKFKGKIKEPNDYANNFFYYYRAKSFSSKRSRNYGNLKFVMILSRILRKKAIEFEYLVAVPQTLGGMKNLLSYDELIWAIRVKGSEQIYSEFDVYANPNEMNQHLFGHDILAITPAKSISSMKVYKENIPAESPSENKALYKMTVSFQDNLLDLLVRRQNTMSGSAKNTYKKLIPEQSFMDEREKNGLGKTRFGVPNVYYHTGVAFDRDFLDDEEERMKESFFDMEKEFDKNRVKSDLEGDGLKVKEVQFVKVISDGRYSDNTQLEFEDQSVVEGVVQKANNYLIVSLGNILGSQFEIRDTEDKERIQTIYFGYTRQYDYEVTLNIPEGYSVSGLEAFNRSVDNATGSYSVSAELKGDKLIVKSSKKYKGIEFTNDHWNEVLEFINLASDVSHSKLVLVKN